MGFLKKYPIFCLLILVFVLVLGGGIYLLSLQGKKLEAAKQSYQDAESRIQTVSKGVVYDEDERIMIAPTAENRQILENRLEEIRADMEQIRTSMAGKAEGILTEPADEFTFLPKLQEFIADMKALAAGGEGREGVGLNSDEAFGFARYALIGDQPDTEKIPELDRQQQVLEYILRQLFASEPTAILSVERELIEATEEEIEQFSNRNEDRSDDVFIIEELVTARLNEFIDTFAFRLVFTGTTDVLRNFLNRIAFFELPLIVRSVEVEPMREQDRPERADTAPASDDPLAALFGGGGASASDEEEEMDEAKKPIIVENESKFTVVIEFVELRLNMEGEADEAEAQEDAA